MGDRGRRAAWTVPGVHTPEPLYCGSDSVLYRARRDPGDAPVAVKLARARGPFEQRDEIELWRMHSANRGVHTLLQHGMTDGGRPYAVMEECPDGDYGRILTEQGPLTTDEAVAVGAEVADALAAVHSRGLLHHAVAPENILRARFGPALIDFGSVLAQDHPFPPVHYRDGEVEHAPPEELRGGRPAPASDVYRLASTVWTLLAGYAPFADGPDGGTPAAAYRERVLASAPPRVPREDVPDWLQEVLRRALASDPAERIANAADFAGMFRNAQASTPGPAEPTEPPPRGLKRPGPRPDRRASLVEAAPDGDRAAADGADTAEASTASGAANTSAGAGAPETAKRLPPPPWPEAPPQPLSAHTDPLNPSRPTASAEGAAQPPTEGLGDSSSESSPALPDAMGQSLPPSRAEPPEQPEADAARPGSPSLPPTAPPAHGARSGPGVGVPDAATESDAAQSPPPRAGDTAPRRDEPGIPGAEGTRKDATPEQPPWPPRPAKPRHADAEAEPPDSAPLLPSAPPPHASHAQPPTGRGDALRSLRSPAAATPPPGGHGGDNAEDTRHATATTQQSPRPPRSDGPQEPGADDSVLRSSPLSPEPPAAQIRPPTVGDGAAPGGGDAEGVPVEPVGQAESAFGDAGRAGGVGLEGRHRRNQPAGSAEPAGSGGPGSAAEPGQGYADPVAPYVREAMADAAVSEAASAIDAVPEPPYALKPPSGAEDGTARTGAAPPYALHAGPGLGVHDVPAPPASSPGAVGPPWPEPLPPAPGDRWNPPEPAPAGLAAPPAPPAPPLSSAFPGNARPRRRASRAALYALAVSALLVAVSGMAWWGSSLLPSSSPAPIADSGASGQPSAPSGAQAAPEDDAGAADAAEDAAQNAAEDSAPQPSQPDAAELAPTSVELRDGTISVTLSWADNTGGAATHHVVGGPVGAEEETSMAGVAPGETSVEITGLNPEVEYCFRVVAVQSTDLSAASKKVCTDRGSQE